MKLTCSCCSGHKPCVLEMDLETDSEIPYAKDKHGVYHVICPRGPYFKPEWKETREDLMDICKNCYNQKGDHNELGLHCPEHKSGAEFKDRKWSDNVFAPVLNKSTDTLLNDKLNHLGDLIVKMSYDIGVLNGRLDTHLKLDHGYRINFNPDK